MIPEDRRRALARTRAARANGRDWAEQTLVLLAGAAALLLFLLL
jgi:hypothetical protein